jgi:hypothetical protein
MPPTTSTITKMRIIFFIFFGACPFSGGTEELLLSLGGGETGTTDLLPLVPAEVESLVLSMKVSWS